MENLPDFEKQRRMIHGRNEIRRVCAKFFERAAEAAGLAVIDSPTKAMRRDHRRIKP